MSSRGKETGLGLLIPPGQMGLQVGIATVTVGLLTVLLGSLRNPGSC